MNNKILIYFDSDIFIRNYLSHNIIKLDNYEVVYYINNKLYQKDKIVNNISFRGFFLERKNRYYLHLLRDNIFMVKFSKRSKSFDFRLRRMRKVKKNLLLILSLPIISNLIILLVNIVLGENGEIKKAILREKPDLVIAPSIIVGTIGNDILKICNKLNIKTFFLLDGWDNISSKTVFSEKPTFIGVWGEQSKKHAIKIQKFNSENIFKIGTPRFEHYSNQNIRVKTYDYNYILFTGCSLPFDEISALHILDNCIEQQKISNLKIIYRPHPWRAKRKCFDFFLESEFKNVILDKQIKEYYYYYKIFPNDSNILQPNLDYYPPLFKNSIFVISPLTTMIIEAALMNKFVLTLAYDDGVHYTNPQNALKYYEHFDGIEKISSFKFCYNINHLAQSFIQMLSLSNNINEMVDFSDELREIISIDQNSYSEKINDAIQKIIDSD